MNRPITIEMILNPKAVLSGIKADNKKQLLQDLTCHAAKLLGLEEHALFDVLWEREQLGTTGVGYGIAIPHGRVEGLTEVRGVFAKLAKPVAFDSVDNRPVDLVFLLLAPASAGADHLHALATVSRLLRNAGLCESLRKARDPAALCRLITTASTAKAA